MIKDGVETCSYAIVPERRALSEARAYSSFANLSISITYSRRFLLLLDLTKNRLGYPIHWHPKLNIKSSVYLENVCGQQHICIKMPRAQKEVCPHIYNTNIRGNKITQKQYLARLRLACRQRLVKNPRFRRAASTLKAVPNLSTLELKNS